MATDISEGLKVELFDRLLETTPHDLVWVFSPEWDELVFLSDGYEQLWGRPRDAVEDDPQALLNGIHPDDRGVVRDAMERVSAGESTDVDCRVVPEEDTHRWIRLHGEPIRDDTGAVVRVACFVRDICARDQGEQHREPYRSIIETVPDGVYVLDSELRFTVVNDALAEMTGYAREELLGSHASLILPGDAIEEGRRIRDRLEDGERELGTLETDLKTASDGRIPCEIRGHLLEASPASDRRVTAGVIRDVTDRKERERRLERQNERLEEFAGIVSHDLRNPLNVAEGRLNLAREDCASEHLDAASDAVDRSLTLLEDLLALAREGRRVDEVEPVELGCITDECWRTVETADATLVVDGDRVLEADRSRFRELLENLLRNAVEHGGEDVTVTVGALDCGFYVADDGPGIPPTEREAVFEAGYSTSADGTGFGLNIVAEIADAHGWEVTATESEAGGTRFEFSGVATSDR